MLPTNRLNLTGSISRAITLLLLVTSASCFATNGYFTHGIGAKNKSLAGAGSAAPGDALATVINPATATYVGSRFEIGLSVFAPSRSYSATTSGLNGQQGTFTLDNSRASSDNKFFPIPYIGKIWDLSDNAAFAFSFYGRGGMNTEFQGGSATFDPDGPGPNPTGRFDGTFGAGKTGVNLSQAFLDITYARQTGAVNWGLSLVLAVQAFEAQGLSNFAIYTKSFALNQGSEMPSFLSDNGHDTSFGAGIKAGVIWEATQHWNLALSYQSETQMQRFDRYSDLFAGGGAFNVPANIRVGVSWQATRNLSLYLDADRIYFSDIEAVGNSIEGLTECPTAGFGGTNVETCLGGGDGPGFGWDDVTTYHFGVQAHFSCAPLWLWRAGYSRSNSPVLSSQTLFNILAPAVIKKHYALGISRALAKGKTVNLSLMYAPPSRIQGLNTFDPIQSIELEMHQFELEIGLSW